MDLDQAPIGDLIGSVIGDVKVQLTWIVVRVAGRCNFEVIYFDLCAANRVAG